MDRSRDQEEYQYTQRRTRDKENNAREDENTQREQLLHEKAARAAVLLEEAEEKAGYMQTLEAQVAGIPALLEAERRRRWKPLQRPSSGRLSIKRH